MSTDLWSPDALVEAYKQYQRRTRGLRERTLDGYEVLVRPFVRAALGEDPVDPGGLSRPIWSATSPPWEPACRRRR